MNTPAVVFFLGGLVSVFTFSARSSYEDLDQNVPFITWTMLLLQLVGLGVAAWAAHSVTQGQWYGYGWLVVAGMLCIAAMRVLDALEWNPQDNWAAGLVELAGNIALAVGIGMGHPIPTGIAVGSAALRHAALYLLLPYEARRRLVFGPGMAVLPLAWLGMAAALNLTAGVPPAIMPGTPYVPGPMYVPGTTYG